jgi:Zn-finger nucleic acid-binding protein
LRLVACPSCHAQYDVTDVAAKQIECRCGESVENRAHAAVDARIARCGSCGAIVAGDAQGCDYCGSAIVRDPGRLGLICPECYARNAEASRFCTACGVAFRPEPVPVAGHELPCPCCGVPMPSRSVAGVGVNECRECHGLWAPGEGFDSLVDRAIEVRRRADPAALQALRPRVRGANPAAQRVEYRRCPECEGFMLRRNFRKSSGVIVDVCSSHGSWLDADELERIAGFILSGGETSPLLRDAPAPRTDPRAAAALARALEGGRREGGLTGLFDVLSALLT